MPMARAVWLAVGAAAILFTLSLGVRSAARWKLRIGGEAIAVLLWGIVAINAFSVVNVTECCRYVNSNPGIGYTAAGITLLLTADLLMVVLQLLGDDPPTETPAAGGGAR